MIPRVPVIRVRRHTAKTLQTSRTSAVEAAVDSVMLLQRVVDETTQVVNDVSEDQLANPSPCEGWTVRDVLNHITGGATMFAISAEQGSVPDEVLGSAHGRRQPR